MHCEIKTQSDTSVNKIFSCFPDIQKEKIISIMSSLSNGGRALEAIFQSKLTSSEKLIMHALGSKMDFRGSFENQYIFMSLTEIAHRTSLTTRTSLTILSKLNDNGYISKKIPSKEDQLKNIPNQYCLTSKIFEEYLNTLLMRENSKRPPMKSLSPPLEMISPPPGNDFTTPPEMVSHIYPINIPNNPINADQQQSKSKIQLKNPSVKKMTSVSKSWEDKTDNEKMDTLVSNACDLHRIAVYRRKAAPFPFCDAKDKVKPLIAHHGLEIIKQFFFEMIQRNVGLDLRHLEFSLKEWREDLVRSNVKNEEDKMAREMEGTIPSKSIEPEVSCQSVSQPPKHNLMESPSFDLSKLPLRAKQFFDTAKPFEKRHILNEIKQLGLEKFIRNRMTAILKCSYDDLFKPVNPHNLCFN